MLLSPNPSFFGEIAKPSDLITELHGRLPIEVNKKTENFGARRLHTIVEKLLEEIMFDAPECGSKTIVIDDEAVWTKVGALVKNLDASRYIL